MKKIYDTYHPPGFSTVNTYLFADDPKLLIEFLEKAFYAEELDMTEDKETGIIRNAILKIGESCIMVSQASGEFLGMRSSFYLYTDDVDKLHQNALDNGATFIFGPDDMTYGDRQSGVKDPCGNYWWISKRLVEKPYGSE